MDSAELEKQISELEEKLDRVRALYEQYFCGIEKLEPQVPRKDLDRRIMILRKEQIRNTAQRFKFNMLVQRYNTMQQHWHRILREIENGTYKRDLARAAARFGVEEALTAVGKKRAERMASGLKAQLERQAKRKQGKSAEDEFEEVDTGDVESLDDEFDDDAPTPPPVEGAVPQAPTFGQPPQAHAQQAWGQPQQAWGDPSQAWAQQGYGHGDYGQGTPHVSVPAMPYPSSMPSGPPDPFAPLPSRASRRGTGQVPAWNAQGSVRAPTGEMPMRPPTGEMQQPPRSVPPGDPGQKKVGGLRLGGGPSKRASLDALNRIASSLGALPGDDADATSAPPEARGSRRAEPSEPPAPRKPLLSSPLGLEVPDPPEARKPLLSNPLGLDVPDPEPQKPAQEAPLGLRPPTGQHAPARVGKSGLAPPPKAGALGLSPPPARAATAPVSSAAVSPRASVTDVTSPPSHRPSGPRAPATVPPEAKPAAETASGAKEPARERGPARVPGAAKPAGKSKEELSDGRLREIYSQYVQSRRDRNESTTGITFEKLADSLRSQAEKLKSKHASKRVDYEIVVKDGKTLIKPIVR